MTYPYEIASWPKQYRPVRIYLAGSFFSTMMLKATKKPIDSGMVNNYIKEATGGDFTAKDFRTWAGTLNTIRALKAMGEAVTETDCKKNILAALDEVSSKLGNTRTVCKKYYVHPGIFRLYEEKSLGKYLKELDAIEKPDDLTGLASDERVLMKILKELVENRELD
jgi:DNA topoisomerase-1